MSHLTLVREPNTRPDEAMATSEATSEATTLAPALYVGTIRHRRFGAVTHAFRYRLFLAYLDVDAPEATLDRLPFWSARRWAPVQFRRRDYFDRTDRPLGDGVRDLVEARTGRRPRGPIRLLTQLRTAGWLFNPLSVYFCFSPNGDRLETIVLEVTNTPRKERTWYVVDATRGDGTGPWEFPKTMFVSPFLDMDLLYRLRVHGPGESLRVQLEDWRGTDRVFAADLALRRIELTPRTALRVPMQHPLLTWRVSAAIYSHAVRLWRKGAPVHPHHPQHDGPPLGTKGEAA